MRGKRYRELALGSSWEGTSKAGQAGFGWASLNHFSDSGVYGLSQVVRYLAPWVIPEQVDSGLNCESGW